MINRCRLEAVLLSRNRMPGAGSEEIIRNAE